MAGNVWEWCANKYKTPDMSNVVQSSDARTLRGGSWGLNSVSCRVGGRFLLQPYYCFNHLGFRVVRVLDPRAEARGENDMDGKNRETVQ